MSLLACSRTPLHQRLCICLSRAFATGPGQTSRSSADKKASTTKSTVPPSSEDSKPPISSCPAGTVLSGLNYLKGQPPVLAMPDEDYPTWLWDLTKPKKKKHEGEVLELGSDAEKRRLRRENRQLLRDKNKFGAR
ncbi:mitochondrial ribosomal protein L37-domain-containing protein [Pisolithus thermaeus]|nr:mitochondrial ribosomal protein L37-domain-containing protein [Pisolithus croceorrhizus]KAI6164081.1 mitochondrial ribosomal protein L37-domain-containing protein [Pisolithus thermaeus]